MENKRDAASAGLGWPLTSNRGTHSTLVLNTTTGDAAFTIPSSSPSASLEPMTATSGTEAGAPSATYSVSSHLATPFPTHDHSHAGGQWHSRYTERVVHQIHFKIFTRSNNERLLFIEEIPSSGISNCRDPEHFFYGLSGNWEWSMQTADYWRHHFEIPLLHGHNPYRHVAIDTPVPPETTSSLTTISDLAGRLSNSLTAAMASGELSDIWQMVENMSFHDAIQALQEATPPTSWYTEWSLAISLYRRYTAIRASSYNCFRFWKRTLLRQGVCVWHICIDVKLPCRICFSTQGVPEALMRPALTKTLISCLWYRWGRSSTYLLFCDLLQWPGAKPRTPPWIFHVYTVTAIWTIVLESTI